MEINAKKRESKLLENIALLDQLQKVRELQDQGREQDDQQGVANAEIVLFQIACTSFFNKNVLYTDAL